MNKHISLAILFAATSFGSAMAGTLRNPFANISLLDSSRVHDLDEVVSATRAAEPTPIEPGFKGFKDASLTIKNGKKH